MTDDKKISELESVTNPDAANDLFAVVSDGETKKSTIDNFITDYLVGVPNIGGDSDWLGPGQTDNSADVYRTGRVAIGRTNSTKTTYMLETYSAAEETLAIFENEHGSDDPVGIEVSSFGVADNNTGLWANAAAATGSNKAIAAGSYSDVAGTDIGLLASFPLGDASNTNKYGIYVQADGTASDNLYGVYIKASNGGAGEGIGFWMEDGTEAAGRVLTCDANGKATWQDTTGITGSGTTNTIAMFSGSSVIADSPLTTSSGNVLQLAGKYRLGSTSTATDDLAVMDSAGRGTILLAQNNRTDGLLNTAIEALAVGANTTGDNLGSLSQAQVGSNGNIGSVSLSGTSVSYSGRNIAAFMQASIANTDAFGVYSRAVTASSAENIAGYFEAANGGAGTHYALQIKDGSETAGHVLTSDADGKATWAAPATPTIGAAGSNKQVQFNDGGARAGDADFTWDKAIETLSIGTTAISKETILVTLANGGGTSALTAISTKTDAIGTAITGTAVTSSAFDNIAASFTASNAGAGEAFALKTFGPVAFDDTKIGFFGETPVVRTAAYGVTNVTPDRDYDANASSVDELADVLGTVIADLQSYGLLQ